MPIKIGIAGRQQCRADCKRVTDEACFDGTFSKRQFWSQNEDDSRDSQTSTEEFKDRWTVTSDST
jgi:hypothetical protein